MRDVAGETLQDVGVWYVLDWNTEGDLVAVWRAESLGSARAFVRGRESGVIVREVPQSP